MCRLRDKDMSVTPAEKWAGDAVAGVSTRIATPAAEAGVTAATAARRINGYENF
jgi:hypothetical protein